MGVQVPPFALRMIPGGCVAFGGVDSNRRKGQRGQRDGDHRELSRHGRTWSGNVSCREVSTITGDTRYYLYVVDRNGRLIASSGAPQHPYVTRIVFALPGGPRGSDGESTAPCIDPADCPPDLRGCPRYALEREACGSDVECGSGGRCAWDGFCESMRE
jgi:hypothetical protein